MQSLEAGARIAQSLGRNRAIVLRNHGMLTVGHSIAQAVSEFVILERVAEAHLKAPHAKPISPDAARFAKADLIRTGHDRASFDFLAAHHT